jgi:hypothetical protein
MLSNMPKCFHFLGLLSITLLLTSRMGIAGDEVITSQSGAQAYSPAPAVGADVGEKPKFYTITAVLREGYDDNIFTAKVHKVGSFTTEVSPSFLLDFPMDNSDFSTRYTFDSVYYANRSGNQFDFNHEFVARYNHAFSDRFNLDLREQFRYDNEPSLLDATGTLFRNGAYISNVSSAEFTAQWTPLVSTVTTYSNTLYYYQDSGIATEQNYMENTLNQDIRFAILPTYTLDFGGIYDTTSYQYISRGFTNYTGNVGVDWQASPSVVFGVRIGGTITDTTSAGSSVSPYASATINWRLGERSHLDFSYLHNVVTTDVVFANAQTADRLSARFSYDVTPSITTHLEGIYTHSDYTSQLIQPSTLSSSFTEDVVAVDTGFAYHFNKNFDFDLGYIFSNVSSQLIFREYTRNQVSVGIRGTY